MRRGNVTLKEEVSGFEVEVMPSKPLTRALCLVFQRQRDGPQDYDISLQKDWDLIVIMMNREVLTVKEVENETIPIAEITKMVSRMRDSRDRIKETDKTSL